MPILQVRNWGRERVRNCWLGELYLRHLDLCFQSMWCFACSKDSDFSCGCEHSGGETWEKFGIRSSGAFTKEFCNKGKGRMQFSKAAFNPPDPPSSASSSTQQMTNEVDTQQITVSFISQPCPSLGREWGRADCIKNHRGSWYYRLYHGAFRVRESDKSRAGRVLRASSSP